MDLQHSKFLLLAKLKGVFSAADVKSEHGERKYSENTVGKVFLTAAIQLWSLRYVFFATAGRISRMNNIKHAV